MTNISTDNPNQDQERIRQEQWIKDNSPGLVEYAKEEHKLQGRGMVVVEWKEESQEKRLDYMAQSYVETSIYQEARRLIRRYDPLTEMVVFVLGPERFDLHLVKMK